MNVKLKKLSEQVVVITGASSGIGLVTARMAARRGARLVVAARAEEALRQLVEEIRAAGGEAEYVVADVGREEDVWNIAKTAHERFGGFDTWVNNAGVSIYGRILDHSTEDMRRLFDTNFWGVVYGSQVAAIHLRRHGGAIINVGSTVGDRAIPVQGVYSASKHAVKGFTDALRMELEAEGAPVSVTLVKPATIDTPYVEHAKNLMERETALPPPVYAPEVVAEAILHCAEHPERDVFAGGSAKALSVMDKYMPRLGDKILETFFISAQQMDAPPRHPDDHGLYRASGELRERSGRPRYVSESSLYTKASLHPLVTGALVFGAGLALAALWRPRHTNGRHDGHDGRRGANGSTNVGAWPSASGLPAEG
ncbi:MAG TPA: SDR family oxidoreductase [Pyrinomonadaceae bacterium]|nr:SDR family oxidoreductase [Pyrinomonadaceae bacterium]